MAWQFDVTTRNAALDARESSIGVSPHLKFITGAVPANTGTSDPGTVVADLALPSDWMAAASGGVKALAGLWQATASASGTIGHFRIFDSGAVCRAQGTVTITGGGGDITVNNPDCATGQVVTITTLTWTEGNA
jgi:hypothetical protein